MFIWYSENHINNCFYFILMSCLWCFFCVYCGSCSLNDNNKLTRFHGLKIEEINQYVPFEDLTGEVCENVYLESIRLKQKLNGKQRERESN